MSLSNKPTAFRAGRIIVGLNAQGLDSLPSAPGQTVFPPEKEGEYLDRVKTKATAKAKAIITTAMHEAKGIKKKAREEGYAQGMEQAGQALEQERQNLAGQLAHIAQKLNAEKHSIWSSHREDIMILLKVSLEKILATEMGKNKDTILGNLLDEAISRIDSRENITIACSPDDKPFLDELVTRAKIASPDLSKWIIKKNEAIQQGGIKIESRYGMVDNSIATRYALVREILDQIKLEDNE